MDEGKPSFTAEINAVIKTVENKKPQSERLCYDPYDVPGVFTGRYDP